MIKKILCWINRFLDSCKTYDPNLLKDGIKKVWSDEYTYLKPMRVDRLEWHDVKDIDKYANHMFTCDFLVDYFGTPVTARFNGAGYWFLGDAFDSAYEGKPMEPQPTMFALLPKLNGND